MTNERLQHLLSRYQQESCSEAEYAELDDWFHSLNYPDINFSQWMQEAGGADQMISNLYEDFSNKYVRPTQAIEVKHKEVEINWWKHASVAAAVAVITLGVWFFIGSKYQIDSNKAERQLYANDIAPGRNTATLTLAEGKVINLDTSKNSVVVADSVKSITTLTAATPRGGTYEVILADGTHVWLNAASSLKFPSAFTGRERIVELTGEAYFEVAKDAKHKFLVRSAGQEVTVLGTHFNVSNYADESSVKTTLLEGSVSIASSRQNEGTGKDSNNKSNGSIPAIVLKPGEQAVLVPHQSIRVTEANITEAIAWKDGYFRFYDENLASIMRKLERWYDIEVTIPESLGRKEFTGKISRSKNISRVLKMLEKTNGVHFKIEGRRVVAIE